MITSEFKQTVEKLNSAQKQAVETIEGAVMVVAGPGTGKTQVLTLRIANILLNTQMNPENILALTFTESAVYEMKERLVRTIGTAGYRTSIYTFHGFCNELIQQYYDEFKHLIAAEPVTELEQIQIMTELFTTMDLKELVPFGDPQFYYKHTLQAINELKKEGVTPEMFREAVQKQQEGFQSIEDLYHEKGAHKGKMKGKYLDLQKKMKKNIELVELYEGYQKQLRKKRMYDFNDMLLEVINVLETSPDFLQLLQERFQYILVDEHQDTNAAQNKIVELLCNYDTNPNLFVVGDEKQAIFRFQGASLENFLYFKSLYPHALLIHLEYNYRSSQTILDAASSIIAFNKKVIRTADNGRLTAQAGHPLQKISVATLDDFFSEYYYIAHHIQKRLDSGASPDSIAVLGRNNRDLRILADVLKQKGIPFTIETETDILQSIEIQKLLIIFRTIQNIGEPEFLVKAMHIDCFGIHPLDVYTLLGFARSQKVSLWDVLCQKLYEGQIDLNLIKPKAIQTVTQQLIEWKTAAENTKFDEVFVKVLHESCMLESVLKKPNATELLNTITQLFEEARTNLRKNNLFSLSDFLEYIRLHEEHTIRISATDYSQKPFSIRLMTAHKSKGLEFDYVYIMNMHDGHWGNQRPRPSFFSVPWEHITVRFDSPEDADRNEDERRLFYVALTRARKEIVVSYAKQGEDGKDQVASQFISEIDSVYLEPLETSDFMASFNKSREQILDPLNTDTDIEQQFLKHKDYFADLFKKNGLSPTALNNYLECPWKYFFKNLLRIPEVKTRHQMFGTSVHIALHSYIAQLGKKPVDLSYLLNQYDEALKKEVLNQEDYDVLLAKGNEVLPGFYNEKHTEWKADMKSEYAIKGIKLFDNVYLRGTLDLIETTEDGIIRIHDFKTSKPKSKNDIEGNTKTSKGNIKRQLVFYKLIFDQYNNGKLRMNTGVIDFVQPNDKGVYKSEEFTILDNEVEVLQNEIIRVAEEIISFSYWNKTCDDKDCEYCKLRSFIG